MESKSFDPLLWKRPDEAYLFFPTKDEEFKIKPKGKIVRFYFDGQIQMLPEESQKIKEFEEYMKSKSLEHPRLKKPIWTDQQILRFLEADQFKFEKTYKSIQSQNQWIDTYMPPKMNASIDKFLNSKITYFSGIDNRCRPILVLNIYEINPKTQQLDDILRGLDYLIGALEDNFFLPGQVENMVIIQDLNNIGAMSLPVSFIKSIIVYLMEHYKSRLYRLYAVNCPSSVTIPWGMVKTILDETTVEKVQFEKGNEPKGLWSHANRAQVEVKFGGKRPNLATHWPPVLPEKDFTLENEKPEDFLISVEKYRELHQTGALVNNRVNEIYLTN